MSRPTVTPAVALRGCTNLKLRQLTRGVSRFYDAYMAEAGLKTTQYSLLATIERYGPLRPGELAQRMRMDASTLTRNLQPLSAQGWVEVGPGEDARSRLVSLTDAGRTLRTQGQRAWKQAQLALNERLGTERVAQLHLLIDECQDLLDIEDEETGDE
ncbi:MAG TPA: MarR family winged helix-turn-helix transcriptional regulator [Burkholderiaceae bacterium]|jgi:DNA-binding MarR family transcriptional regulator|nr:MarR family winged helix-turn-helix transcriptional regulator [Burkholderiaceae bacterium]